MALLPVLIFPDPRLRLVAKPVTTFDADLAQMVSDMFETMYEQGGCGLAATQVNIQKRIFVMDCSRDPNKKEPYCIINPEVLHREGSFSWEEGCLSFPGVYAKINHAADITIQYQDVEGNTQTLEAKGGGLLSACIQHESDHLEGKVFTDYLSPLKRAFLLKKMEKLQKFRSL